MTIEVVKWQAIIAPKVERYRLHIEAALAMQNDEAVVLGPRDNNQPNTVMNAVKRTGHSKEIKVSAIKGVTYLVKKETV